MYLTTFFSFLLWFEFSQSANQSCGYTNDDGIGFRSADIQDVEQASFGEFPWMLSIFSKDEILCGASLIHLKVALTAAHCINPYPGNLVVRAGDWDISGTQEILKHQERKVSSIVIKQLFHKQKLENDIALLFLEFPFEKSSHIGEICLPPQNSIILSDDCYVTGWGKINFEDSVKKQNILKKVLLPMMNREKCIGAFKSTRLGRRYTLHQSFVCAGGEENKDSCIGDGGGPLICPISTNENRYQQVGITSWGIGCGKKGVPGAYTNVALFRDWIDTQLRERGISTDHYNY